MSVPLSPGANTAQVRLRGFPASYAGGQVYGHVTSALSPPGRGVAGCLVSATPSFSRTGKYGSGSDVLTDGGGVYVLDNVPIQAGNAPYSLLFDASEYDLVTKSVVPVAKAAVRCDAVLSPFDGRLPAGWTYFISSLRSTSRPVNAIVVSPGENTATTNADGDAVSQVFVTTKDTTQLARFRRTRWNHDQPTDTHEAQFRFAAAFAPGTKIHGAAAAAMEVPTAITPKP